IHWPSSRTSCVISCVDFIRSGETCNGWRMFDQTCSQAIRARTPIARGAKMKQGSLCNLLWHRGNVLKVEGPMSVLHKPRYRAILILAFAGVGISIVAWTVCKNPVINFLPGD